MGVRLPMAEGTRPMLCRWCDNEATLSIRSGFEDHPCCEDCAGWWTESRQGDLAAVEDGYVYPEDSPHGEQR